MTPFSAQTLLFPAPAPTTTPSTTSSSDSYTMVEPSSLKLDSINLVTLSSLLSTPLAFSFRFSLSIEWSSADSFRVESASRKSSESELSSLYEDCFRHSRNGRLEASLAKVWSRSDNQ